MAGGRGAGPGGRATAGRRVGGAGVDRRAGRTLATCRAPGLIAPLPGTCATEMTLAGAQAGGPRRPGLVCSPSPRPAARSLTRDGGADHCSRKARRPSREPAPHLRPPGLPTYRRADAGDVYPGPRHVRPGSFHVRGRLMPATVIVGLQWGDEGKGKTTDFLAEQVAMVVRYQGGDNAGHTVVIGDEVVKLHLVPVGRALPAHHVGDRQRGRRQPGDAHRELDMLARAGIDVRRVRVSRSAHVIMPYHVALDRANEARLGGAKVGTTGRGIGPDLRRPGVARRAAHGGPARREVLRERIDGAARCRTRTSCSSSMGAAGFEVEPLVDAGPAWGERSAPPRRHDVARPGRARRGEHVLSRAPGHAARPRPRQLPVRDLVQPGRRRRVHRRRDRAAPGRRGHRRHEGLLDPRRLGAVPDRAGRRDRRRDRGARPRVRDDHRRPRRVGWFDAVPCATRSRSTRVSSIMLNKLDILSGLETIRAVRRLRDRRPARRRLAVLGERARARTRSTRTSRAGRSRSTTSARSADLPETPAAT